MATKTLTATEPRKSAIPESPFDLSTTHGKVFPKTEDDLLKRSLILDFDLRPKRFDQVDRDQTKQLGGTLLQRAEDIYVQTKAVRNLASNVRENPSRFGCSIVALATGLARIYSGDVITGGIATVLGAKELYNQCGSRDTSHLQRLLSDINADVDMVRSLEEGQQQSYKVIEENLTLISADVQTLYAKLDQIKDLNIESLKALEGAKKQAYEKGLEAKGAYREALELFKEAKDSFGASKAIYVRCAAYFQRIKDLAIDEDEETPILEKVNSLVEVADQASTECAQGKQKLDNADQKFSEAMAALSRAVGLKDQAIELISQTVQNAKDTLKAGADKAQYTAECHQRIEATRKEMQEVKERSNDVMRLLNEMSEDVKKAKTEASKKLDPSDVVVGVGTGVVLSSVGTFSAIALGVAAAYAWHNGTTIANTTKKVYNYFFGTPLPPPVPMGDDEMVRVNLLEKSTGYWGAWVRGRQSFTFGSVDVNLGRGEVMQMRFDLNNQAYPVSKEDLFTLYNRMFVKLGNGSLSPERCKAVLTNLQTVIVQRGGLNPNVTGLIRERQAAHGLVRALNNFCDKLETQAKIASPVKA